MRRPILLALVVALGALAPAGAAVGQTPPRVLDTGFGSAGSVFVPFGPKDEVSRAGPTVDGVVAAAGGKVVLGGTAIDAATGRRGVALVRLAADGTLDATFDGDGRSFVPVPGTLAPGGGLTALPDGRLVFAGTLDGGASGDDDVIVGRFSADGAPDPGFGAGGFAVVTAAGDDTAAAVAPAPNGDLLVAGSVTTAGAPRMTLLRLGTAGAVLSTSSATASTGGSRATSLAVTAQGAILGGPDPVTPGAERFAVWRTTAADVTRAPTAGTPAALVELPGGGLLQGGVSAAGRFALVRYTPEGAVDPAFNGGLGVETSVGDGQAGIAALSPLADGRVLAAGWAQNDGAVGFAVARYLPDGRLDPAFGAGGVRLVPLGNRGVARAAGLVAQPGRVVLGGAVVNDDLPMFGAAAVLDGGALGVKGDPAPTGDRAGPRLSLPRTLKLDSRGKVRIRLACPRDERRCKGTLAVTRGRSRYGRKTFNISGGKSKILVLQISPSGRRRVARRTRVRVTVAVQVRDSAGNRSDLKRTATLRRKR